MALNDIFQAALQFNIKGEKVANVLHFKQTSSDVILPANEDLVAGIREDIWPSYQAILSEDVTLQSIACKKISPALGGSVVVPVNEAGTVAEDTMPTQSTVVATLYSDSIGARFRGRIYISGVPKTLVQDGRILNSAATDFVTFLDTLKTTVQAGTGATFAPGVWSVYASIFSQYTYHELRAFTHTLRGRRMAST